MRVNAPLLVLVSLLALGCSSAPRRGGPPRRAEDRARLELALKTGLVIGEFPIDGADAVVDGDTIKVNKLDASMRLLALDTEETFKTDEERRGYALGMKRYCELFRGNSPRPVKMATPMGEEAKRFARRFFDGVDRVRLERDHPGEIRDYYGRYLAYVFAEKDGEWVNYNLAAVRAGMSPYFAKYGRSRRFHEQFVEAQRLAREEQLGIWNPEAESCHDYDERLAWWDARGAAIAAFEREQAKNPEKMIALTRWDALRQLEKRVGQEVVVLASVGDIRLGTRGPSIVKLNRSRSTGLDLVFWDKDVLASSGVAGMVGEYVQVRGTVTRYVDKRSGRPKLQIHVSLPGQLTLPGTDDPLPTAGTPVEADVIPADTAVDDALPDDEKLEPGALRQRLTFPLRQAHG